MAVPIGRILAHELGQHRDTREGVQWDTRLLNVQARRDIDGERLGLRGLGYAGLTGGESRKRRVCAVESESASDMDWNVDLDHIIEARLESVQRSAQGSLPACPRRNSLVLFEFLPIELLVLAGNVHPQAALSTYRARGIKLESYTVCWERRWSEIDVWRISREVRRAIVLEGQEVDGVVVDLLWRHGVDVLSVAQRYQGVNE